MKPTLAPCWGLRRRRRRRRCRSAPCAAGTRRLHQGEQLPLWRRRRQGRRTTCRQRQARQQAARGRSLAAGAPEGGGCCRRQRLPKPAAAAGPHRRGRRPHCAAPRIRKWQRPAALTNLVQLRRTQRGLRSRCRRSTAMRFCRCRRQSACAPPQRPQTPPTTSCWLVRLRQVVVDGSMGNMTQLFPGQCLHVPSL